MLRIIAFSDEVFDAACYSIPGLNCEQSKIKFSHLHLTICNKRVLMDPHQFRKNSLVVQQIAVSSVLLRAR